MAGALAGRRVAFLLTDGYEDSELTGPWGAVTRAGATATLVSTDTGTVRGKRSHSQSIDVLAGQTSSAAFDALVLPGGVINADHLRMDDGAVALVRGFVHDDKPIAVICHGAWILTEADAVRGRRMTSYPSLRTDLRNAGAQWVDEEVAIDGSLISSRTPADLPAFNAALVKALTP